jgi:hypothetical protein
LRPEKSTELRRFVLKQPENQPETALGPQQTRDSPRISG